MEAEGRRKDASGRETEEGNNGRSTATRTDEKYRLRIEPGGALRRGRAKDASEYTWMHLRGGGRKRDRGREERQEGGGRLLEQREGHR